MNEIEKIKAKIIQFQPTEPIFVDELFDTDMTKQQKDNLYVILSRLVKAGILRHYAQGIYFIPKISRFGIIGIDRQLLIEKKYLRRNNQVFGYVTGPQVWNAFGLTTQLANRIWIAQVVKQKKIDEKMQVVITRAKGSIKNNTIKSLQFIDILEQIELIQDSSPDEIIKKMVKIFKYQLSAFEKTIALFEVQKYAKKVQVLFGLIAETAQVEDQNFSLALHDFKMTLQSGKKTIITQISPEIFAYNRTWRNGYATP